MSKKRRRPKLPKSASGSPTPAPAEVRRIPAPTLLLLGLATAGMLLTAYLTGVKWLGSAPLYCGQDSACDVVQSSRWSTLLGLPLAFWGFLTYVVLTALILRIRKRPGAWVTALLVATVGVGISVYLTAVSVFEIEATCAYCLASFALISVILVMLWTQKPKKLQSFRWPVTLLTHVLSAAIVVGGLHAHYSGVFDPGAGPEKPYLKALAEHLADSGAKFYGAYWCPRCEQQKTLFEASATRLPYVECSPNGRRGTANFACVSENVTNYPTWVINGRREVGLVELSTLARMSRFKWDGPRP